MRRGLGFHNRRSPGVFNPASLFAGGTVQGAWYDPSDLTTLFQDAAGTTPVTAVEQAVGLMLDKSKGLVLGSELNGDPGLTGNGFWLVTDPSITVGSGKVSYSSTPTNNALYKSPLLTAGKFYQITITIANRTAGGISIETPGTNGLNFNTNGTFTCRVRQQSSSIIYFTSVGTTTLDITSISIRELPGNHAYQSTSASRPTLRARYNLLTRSEEFNNADWVKAAGGVGVLPVVTANAGTAPDGTLTADRIQFDCGNTSSATNRSRIQQAVTLTLGQAHTGRIWIKAYDVSNVGKTVRFVIESNSNEIIHTLTADWVAVSLPGTATNTAGNFLFETRGLYTQQTADVLVWGAQFTQPAVFPSNTYQRVGAATDYATGAAFPPYLFFDGTDDSMLTNSVDFTGTDKMLVVAGVTKSSDAALGMLAELGAPEAASGGFFVAAPRDATTANYSVLAASTLNLDARITSFAAPITNVLSAAINFAGATNSDYIAIRANGAATTPAYTGSRGTGNFGNKPLFIGRRNNATLPFNGQLYSLVIAGAAYSAGQISSAESWVAAKTPLGTI